MLDSMNKTELQKQMNKEHTKRMITLGLTCRVGETPEAIIRNRTEKVGLCWIWTGFKNNSGYGQTSFKGKSWRAHRLLYYLFKGPIANGMTIDHLCQNKACVNPEHLQVVSSSENIARRTKKKKKCLFGHHIKGKNRMICYLKRYGKRVCKICHDNKKLIHNTYY